MLFRSSRLQKEQAMAIVSTARRSGADRAIGAFSRFAAWLAASIIAAIGRAGISSSAALDDMSEAQLKDIGVMRFNHDLRWPDRQEYEHRAMVDDPCRWKR
jgi:hypothetical protein